MTFSKLCDVLLHAFFPDRCAFCEELLPYDKRICDRCRSALNRQELPICTDCGRSKAQCQCKEDGRRHWDGAAAPFVYEEDGVAGEGVRRLKHSHDRKNAETLAAEIVVCVKENFSDVVFDCVMAVPMTRNDEYERGYSQSRWLAESVAKGLGVPFEDKLKKIMQTEAQKKLSAKQRRVNLLGAFDMDERYDAPDKTVLVIDDAITTGSTVDECARILKIYGAKAVYVAALCIVYKKGTNPYGGSKTGN